jgi:hypothetical protein|tara:strand:+ start:208 stop:522 length:315 start_codon:yes stop_codon:yes gene_type:complete
MTEFEKLDTDKNGSLDKDEFRALEIEDKKLIMYDNDAKRNLERKLVTMSAFGLILYPLVIILASWLGLDQAASLVTDVASVFVVASSGIIVGYMGVNAIREKNQ